MTVTDREMGIGAFSVPLLPVTPGDIRDKLSTDTTTLAHVVITSKYLDLSSMDDDDALGLARYVGVYLKRTEAPLELHGRGVNWWLGGGDIGPTTGGTSDTAQTFAQWATRCTPDGLGVGIRSSISGTYAKEFELTYLRDIADDVADRFGSVWRVTNDFKLDFGTTADLFRTSPIAVVVRHAEDGGQDFNVRGIPGELEVVRDVEDSPRRIIFRWDNAGTPADVIQAGGIADADYPRRGPDGGAPFLDRIEDDPQTKSSADATARSASMLSRLGGVRSELRLSGVEYDIGDRVAVGDPVYVFDRERGIYDLDNPVLYRGQTIYPEVIRCVGHTWPIKRGMGVWVRRWVKPSSDWEIEWIDLTPYVAWESGSATVEVGAKPRRIF